MPSDQDLFELLTAARTVAVVGMSDRPTRPSHALASFLQRHGYRILPVNPHLTGPVLGEQPYANLRAIAEQIDIAVIFRRPEFVPDVVDDAIAIRAGTVWMQLGIVNHEAALQARRAGLTVVMDRCMAIEHRRLNRYAQMVA